MVDANETMTTAPCGSSPASAEAAPAPAAPAPAGRAVLARLLGALAPLFARLADDERDAALADARAALQDVSEALGADEEEGGRAQRALDPLDADARSALRDELLVSGLPFAALPVESLYKPWSAQPGNAFGAARGLFLGDAARHVQAVYDELSLNVPHEFASMPDHLSLELELLTLLLEAGNGSAARQFAADHLDWLGAYDAALADRAAAAEASAALPDGRRAALAAAAAHQRALLALADRAVRRAVA